MRRLLATFGFLMLAGCAAPPQVGDDRLAVVPADFSIDLTILTDRRAARGAEPHLWPSKVVVFPDGELHYGTNDERGARLPPFTRRLSRQQMADLWNLAVREGLADPDHGDHPVDLKITQAPPNHVVYVARLTGDGDRWAFVRSFATGEPADAALAPLARRLVELAWATDQFESRPGVVPRRYDLGPDPYARYR
ncbi:MAG: hypothetical protein ACYSTY_05905 [Planctomycetota bacterium]|jgi:hypothetical protein